ncbi:MAG: hypothetical protein ACK5VI_10480 [Opitutia bacterium]
MTVEHVRCVVMIAWSVVRAGHMRPSAPMLDRVALSTLGGAAVAYLIELHIYGAPRIASQLVLAGVALWVVPPSLRCWLRNTHLPHLVRVLIGGDK